VKASGLKPEETAALNGLSPATWWESRLAEFDTAHIRPRHHVRSPQREVERDAGTIRIVAKGQRTNRRDARELARVLTGLRVYLEEAPLLVEEALD